jgi:hypothetical protein
VALWQVVNLYDQNTLLVVHAMSLAMCRNNFSKMIVNWVIACEILICLFI